MVEQQSIIDHSFCNMNAHFSSCLALGNLNKSVALATLQSTDLEYKTKIVGVELVNLFLVDTTTKTKLLII